jgi:putative ABC transport system permease protein
LKKIEVRDQVSLGPKRCLDLSVAAMSYRISRSAVTILILSLAVAFLAYILYYGTIQHDTEYHAYQKLQKERLMGKWMTRLSVGDNLSTIIYNFRTGRTDRIEEYAAWAGLDSRAMARMQEAARRIHRFDEYFARVSMTDRTIVLGEKTPLQFLQTQSGGAQQRSNFLSQMTEMKMKPIFETREDTRVFLADQVPFFLDNVARITAVQDSCNRMITGRFDKDIMQAFTDEGVDLHRVLQENGYVISQDEVARIRTQARIAANVQLVGEFVSLKKVAPQVAKKLNVDLSEVNTATVIRWIGSQSRAQWFADLMKEHRDMIPQVISADMLLEMADNYREKAKLQGVVGDKTVEPRSHVFALDNRTLWLILVSFVVCLVGISNTMLMSVTERFGEIATMKCIGAMDGFVMLEFVFEAIIQGVVGSFIGIIFGFVLASLRAFINYGFMFLGAMHWGDMIIVSVISFITGIVISAISATGPSWTASKLPPMEAMRVE